jgi:hypothetical protein
MQEPFVAVPLQFRRGGVWGEGQMAMAELCVPQGSSSVSFGFVSILCSLVGMIIQVFWASCRSFRSSESDCLGDKDYLSFGISKPERLWGLSNVG